MYKKIIIRSDLEADCGFGGPSTLSPGPSSSSSSSPGCYPYPLPACNVHGVGLNPALRRVAGTSGRVTETWGFKKIYIFVFLSGRCQCLRSAFKWWEQVYCASTDHLRLQMSPYGKYGKSGQTDTCLFKKIKKTTDPEPPAAVATKFCDRCFECLSVTAELNGCIACNKG